MTTTYQNGTSEKQSRYNRIQANQLLATRLIRLVGLSAPGCRVIRLGAALAARHLSSVEYETVNRACATNLGIKFTPIGDPIRGSILDSADDLNLTLVKNLKEFAGILAFDIWTSNLGPRQAVFFKQNSNAECATFFIDHGLCFGGSQWRFHDNVSRLLFERKAVYKRIKGWNSFEPWLTKLEEMDPNVLWFLVSGIPEDWHGGKPSCLRKMIDTLLGRRKRIRDLITQVRRSDPKCFPLWSDHSYMSINTGVSPCPVQILPA